MSSNSAQLVIIQQIKGYWAVIKFRQTILLACTGVAGYLGRRLSSLGWHDFIGLTASLLLSISGATALNMVYDRDLDRKMTRTRQRPLAAGHLDALPVSLIGTLCIVLGLGWALTLSPLYGLVVFLGVFLDVVVYTIWLKRRTAWSIILGGLAGGMPVLAGSVLASGKVELTGILLALSIVSWIPSHNLTLNLLYKDDFLNAGIPTFLARSNPGSIRIAIMLSNLLTICLMALVLFLLGSRSIYLATFIAFSMIQVSLSIWLIIKPGVKSTRVLYKATSLYMLLVIVLVALRFF